jgi:hypothetical protein
MKNKFKGTVGAEKVGATFDVTLPASQPIVFPPRCVVCEAKNPDERIQLSFLGSNTWGNTLYKVRGNTLNKVKGIPVCKGCAGGLRWHHRFQMTATYVFCIAVGLLAALSAILLDVSLFVMMPAIVGFVALPVIITLIFPPSFDATFKDGIANFEFKSKTVADEFMELNSET